MCKRALEMWSWKGTTSGVGIAKKKITWINKDHPIWLCAYILVLLLRRPSSQPIICIYAIYLLTWLPTHLKTSLAFLFLEEKYKINHLLNRFTGNHKNNLFESTHRVFIKATRPKISLICSSHKVSFCFYSQFPSGSLTSSAQNMGEKNCLLFQRFCGSLS